MDCFAYKGETCDALDNMECVGCAFYKTEKQQLKDAEAANERLRGLDNLAQQYLADKYHEGKRIWENR